MVKLGDAFIELSAVEAIAPIRNSYGYAVFLTGGRIMNLYDVSEEDVARVLADSGFLELMEAAPVHRTVELTSPERAELHEVFARGCRFAAKDLSGVSYAYTDKPRKGAKTWVNDDDESDVWRLRNDYEALDFLDDAPLDLACLFAGEPT